MVSARPSQRRSSGSPLTVKKILAWADAHHRRTGHWPTINSGEIPGANGDTWSRVYCALYQGLRGLPGGSSLSKLLAEHRGVRNRMRLPRLTKKQILAWADAHQKKKGRWPTRASGAVLGNEDESWKWINQALVRGQRGLPGGDTLASLLKKRRGAQPKRNTRSLSVAKILTWADAHYRRYKQWPNLKCDRVTRTDGETWPNLNAALEQGLRGLPGGSSLAKLLAEHRGVRNRHTAPPLTMEQILDWADQHRASTGEWPKESSGQVSAAPDETWNAISASLQRGMRGLPGDSSLSKLLQAHRGYRNPSDPPRLTEKLILAWADAHHERTRRWPKVTSGAVEGQPAETWRRIDSALRNRGRGLRRTSSLAKLLSRKRGVSNRAALPRLTLTQVLAWARAHRRETGRWPSRTSGEVRACPGEHWQRIDDALNRGHRGLPNGLSLAKLRQDQRRATSN